MSPSTVPTRAPVSRGVDLPVQQPFDAPGVFGFLAARAVAGVEHADLTGDRLRYARTLVLPHGPGTIDLVASPAAGSWQVHVDLELTSAADLDPAVARVRHLLDLDADPVTVDTALAADPVLAPLVERTRGIRVPGAVDAHEILVRAMVGQQISVAAATTHLARLTTEAGSRHASQIPGLDRLFPTAAQIVRAVPAPVPGEPLDPDRPLRLPGQGVRSLVATCGALADGSLDLAAGGGPARAGGSETAAASDPAASPDPGALRARLVERRGIGPWTASYVAMRVLGDPDAWLLGDVALLAGAQAVGAIPRDLPRGPGHRALADRAATWAPWRSYAAMHLWQAAA
ncbi:DNA-3-methyladenine glycosylase family protein [Actinotalea soli]|uniref:DNA-3-methyladenine glycosylase family protein n=1 Tax=Actinotalea soli TaxID=2819234 RepID=UPI0027DD1FD6|nr:AlkA N-terminal domain-containing protein [Actinotalea soli]